MKYLYRGKDKRWSSHNKTYMIFIHTLRLAPLGRKQQQLVKVSEAGVLWGTPLGRHL